MDGKPDFESYLTGIFVEEHRGIFDEDDLIDWLDNMPSENLIEHANDYAQRYKDGKY